MQKIVVWLSTPSRMSLLPVWKRMHPWPSLPISTCWRWGETKQKVEKIGYSKNSFAILKENNRVQGCVSHNSDPKKSILWRIEIERFGGTHHKILRTHLVPNSKSGKKRAISWSYSKNGDFVSAILARLSLRIEHLRRLQDMKIVPAKQHGMRREIYTFYSSVETKAAPVLISKNPEDRMFVFDSGASMHMLSKKDWSSDETGYFVEDPETRRR